ncbi:HutD family protein [Streptomyces sp. NPDC004111]|uniref:HutD/Ves family protein n=1 Tax=Streptomyces sp. NPDC004111 TaxID=3364690 RepID=UPI00369110E1
MAGRRPEPGNRRRSRVIRLLRAAERTVAPWKNGGGVTRAIAGGPAGSGTAGFDWRVSLADVASDGPFSAFPGVDRILTMVEGAGMDLALDGLGRRQVDTRHVPQHFPGDVPTHCRLLDGPVVNLNVMYRRGGGTTAEVAVVRGDVTVAPAAPDGTTVAVVLDAPAAFTGSALTAELGPYDAVLCDGADGGVLAAPGGAVLITVRGTAGGDR